MSTPEDLMDLYIDELRDLWSANDQMARLLKKITPKADDNELKEMLERSIEGIGEHTDLLKELLAAQSEKTGKDHCKGMEGLVEEAKSHILDDGPDKGPVRDAVIITQYQRMTHYGIAGFGTAAAFAAALGLEEDQQRLKEALGDMYQADRYLSRLAETCINLQAADEAEEA